MEGREEKWVPFPWLVRVLDLGPDTTLGYFLSTQDTKSLGGLFYQNPHLQSTENSTIYDLVSVRIASSARYFPF